MPLESGTPLRIDSETLRKTSVFGLNGGPDSRDLFDQGLCILWSAVRRPRCSLDENRIAAPIATKILRRTLADGLTLAFEQKLDAAHATLNGPSVAV